MPWGTIDTSPASRGLWQRVRLTVYPPGITSAERRALHFAHAWPIAGAVLGLFAGVLLSADWPGLGLAAVLSAYLVGFLVGARITRELRAQTRTLIVLSEYVGGELKEYGNVHLLREAASRLSALEARRRDGSIDAVAYEAGWAEVYDSLPAPTAPVAKSHASLAQSQRPHPRRR